MPSYGVSEHATKSPDILRLTKAAVSEPNPHSIPKSQFPLIGDPLLSQVSRDREKTPNSCCG